MISTALLPPLAPPLALAAASERMASRVQAWFDTVTPPQIWAKRHPTPRWRVPRSFPTAPGPEQVLPSLPSKRLKIVCLRSTEPAELGQQVKAACREQADAGLILSSTFSHDGSIFLVFKRSGGAAS